MESEMIEHLREAAKAVRQMNSAAPEGRSYLLTVQEEGLTVHARQRGKEVKYILEWDLLAASIVNPVPAMLRDARARLVATLREEDG